MKHIVYVHGLNATRLSFNYIKHKLPEHDHVLVEYNSHQPLADSIEQVKKQLPKGELVLVGHSLGGLIATIIAIDDRQGRVKRLVTMSSPLTGSKSASAMRWFPGADPVLTDIIPGNHHLLKIAAARLTIPTLSIISTVGGTKFIPEPNDGVVSIESQLGLNFGKKIEIKANHFEVLASDKMIKALSDFVFKEDGLLHEDHIEDGTAITTTTGDGDAERLVLGPLAPPGR